MKNKYKTPRFPQSEEKRMKDKARSEVRKAILDGSLVEPQHCEKCGKKCRRRLHPEDGGHPMHAHHGDYSKPLDVEWLCLSCHRKHHHTISLRLARAQSRLELSSPGPRYRPATAEPPINEPE